MSSIYIQEPPCSGKVLLETTVGDIDIELWSKEAPKACRNFVQLCLENYYDGTIFHRVVKGFIAQGGDPNGDGTGGESVYGEPFKDEFHSRLRFVRRGLVAVANSGNDDNGSQFFFTLGPCPELQKKHTIFGKVTGDTLYNMLKLEDCIVDGDDRPAYPHKIISTRVLLNPFPDVVPRTKKTCKSSLSSTKPVLPPKKDFKLLSFGEEAEEEESEISAVSEKYRGKSKSSHDLANDPKLSSVSVMALYGDDKNDDSYKIEHIRKKLKKCEKTVDGQAKLDSPTFLDKQTDCNEENKDKRKLIQKEIKELMKDLKSHKSHAVELQNASNHKEEKSEIQCSANSMLEDYHKQSAYYKDKCKDIPRDPTERSKKTLELLEKFTNKLKDAQSESNSDGFAEEAEEDEEIGSQNRWLSHQLHCEMTVPVAKDANVASADRYDITDPRNPINQRRRLESKITRKR